MKNIDEKIKTVLEMKTKDITADNCSFEKIKQNIIIDKKESVSMKKLFAVKVIIAVLSLAAVSCIASTNVSSWHTVTNNANDVYEFPTQEYIQKKAGYVPKYVKTIAPGYDFEYFNISDATAQDADGNAVVKMKNITFDYKVDKSDDKYRTLLLDTMKVDKETFEFGENESDDIIDYNGISIRYNDYTAMYFPPECEGKNVEELLTQEQLELYKQDKISVSYGSDKIMENKNQSVMWYEDGIGYVLLSVNNSFSQDDLIEMAKNIINQ